MSPGMNNFFEEMLEAAKAREALPLVQAENDRLHNLVEDYAKQVQRLEMKLIDRSNEIDSLNAAVRQAEVSRDDAELRFLELEDKTGRVIAALGAITDAAGTARNLLDPPKPEAPPTPVAVQGEEPVPAGVTEPHPFGDGGGGLSQPVGEPQAAAQPSDIPSVAASAPVPDVAVTSTGSASEGVSVLAGPTAVPVVESTPTDAGATEQGAQASETPPTPAQVDPTTGTTTATADTGATDGVSVSVDPTTAANPDAGSSLSDGAATPNVDSQAGAQPNEVGYHNEPVRDVLEDFNTFWSRWHEWADRMSKHYGPDWPQRPGHAYA